MRIKSIHLRMVKLRWQTRNLHLLKMTIVLHLETMWRFKNVRTIKLLKHLVFHLLH
jgi:hypothetical protein